MTFPDVSRRCPRACARSPGRRAARECRCDGAASVEAISSALNLAPIPRDRGGKRNSACKAALVGLANHAGPDGTGAFPSVRTLVRYTDLSERTARIALDRLAADGIIRPCDPAIVAARIKRATSARKAGTWRCT